MAQSQLNHVLLQTVIEAVAAADDIDTEGPVGRWVGTRAQSQYKDSFSRYGDFHYKDKTVVFPLVLPTPDQLIDL